MSLKPGRNCSTSWVVQVLTSRSCISDANSSGSAFKSLAVLKLLIPNGAFRVEIVYFDCIQAFDTGNGALDFSILGRQSRSCKSARASWLRCSHVDDIDTT